MLTGQCVELGAEGLPLAPLVDALRTLARTMPPDVLAGVSGPPRPGCPGCCPNSPRPRHRRPADRPGPPVRTCRKPSCSSSCSARSPAKRRSAGAVRDRGPALGRPVHAGPDRVPVRSLRNARVLLVVTYRSDELHRRHPLRPLLTSWERDRSIDRIDLRRFDRDEVAAQLTRSSARPRRPPSSSRLRPLGRQRLPGRGAGRDGPADGDLRTCRRR